MHRVYLIVLQTHERKKGQYICYDKLLDVLSIVYIFILIPLWVKENAFVIKIP